MTTVCNAEKEMTTDDELVTADRAKVQKLYLDRTIVPRRDGFACPTFPGCKATAGLTLLTGTWPYIGAAYGEAKIDGRLARILFVAMDRGGKREHAWNEETFANTQEIFRLGTEKPTNAHMGGVHSLLKELLDDREPGVSARQYALTNAVKCARATDRMDTGATRTMVRNCSEHLRAEIELLDPDLLVTQGSHPKDTTLALFPDLRPTAPPFIGRRRRAMVLVSSRFVMLATPHPARCPGWKWKSGPLPDFVQQAVDHARCELKSLMTARHPRS